jgi:LemA protein
MILFVILAIVVLYAVYTFNSFVTYTNRSKEASSDIDVQLKRRYDLIPNLVNTVKGYADHEKGTFDSVISAREKAMATMSSGTFADKAKAENALSGTLKSLFALTENYPDLKANANFLDLQHELTDTEDKIQASRRFYNSNVRDLNISLEKFPGNMIGNLFHFQKMELFDIGDDTAARNPVAVKF